MGMQLAGRLRMPASLLRARGQRETRALFAGLLLGGGLQEQQANG